MKFKRFPTGSANTWENTMNSDESTHFWARGSTFLHMCMSTIFDDKCPKSCVFYNFVEKMWRNAFWKSQTVQRSCGRSDHIFNILTNCRVRVSRSYQSCLSPYFLLSLLPSFLPCLLACFLPSVRPSFLPFVSCSSRPKWALLNLNCKLLISLGTAPQWALPDLNCKLHISVGTAGHQLRAPDFSGHCRTSAASTFQWAVPDLNRKRQIECQDRCQ